MKEIEGYEGYFITEDGNVYSNHRGKLKKMKSHETGIGGYFAVGLVKDKVQCQEYIHRLLAKAFIPNPENKPCINHKDGNKQNNALLNLEWCTYKENAIHAYQVLKVQEQPKYKKSLEKRKAEAEKRKEIKEKKAAEYRESLKIVCINTGEVFDNMSDAARKFQTTRQNIEASIHLNFKVKGKYNFKKINDNSPQIVHETFTVVLKLGR